MRPSDRPVFGHWIPPLSAGRFRRGLRDSLGRKRAHTLPRDHARSGRSALVWEGGIWVPASPRRCRSGQLDGRVLGHRPKPTNLTWTPGTLGSPGKREHCQELTSVPFGVDGRRLLRSSTSHCSRLRHSHSQLAVSRRCSSSPRDHDERWPRLRTQPPAAASASATRFDISSGGTSSTWVATFH